MLSPWPPPRREKRLSVALPASVLSVEETLELKTIKAGMIGRALAIFRVDEAIVYRDQDTREEDLRLLEALLNYMVTPPHLRKRLFPLSPQLSAVGLLPPLRLVTHDAPRELSVGDRLEGYVESCDEESCEVYLGRLGRGILLGRTAQRSRVTVRVKSLSPLLLEPSSWGDVYVGFEVRREGVIEGVVERLRRAGYIAVASSRLGRGMGEVARSLLEKAREAKGVLVVFGGPRICPYENSPDIFDLSVNTVPFQGTFTVRTEEALYATLSALTNAGLL
ncbi:MAG: hypothetical protein N3F67_01295 [Acidilobaceae archaeon]|nr:hypothetical protein [Acidilobaceae archaeon]